MSRIGFVVLLLVLTACGSSGSPAINQATTKPSPTISTASDQQYASVVAPFGPKVAGLYRQVNHCAVFYIPACRIEAVNAGITAYTVVVDLRGAQHPKPGNRLYIGAAPSEIAALVAKTMSGAQGVTRAVNGLNHPSRAAEFEPLDFALSTLNDDLRAWGPYGG